MDNHKHLKRLFEKRAVNMVIKSDADPGDGTRSLSARITDNYTGEELCKLEWYYELDELLTDLDNAARAIGAEPGA